MFGLIDRVKSIINNQDPSYLEESTEFIRHKLGNLGSESWVVFLPWRLDLKAAQKHDLIPKGKPSYVYQGPKSLIAIDPHLTRKCLMDIAEDFITVYQGDEINRDNLHFLGLSVGNLPAFYLANRFHCKSLTSVCGIDKLGEGIFSSYAARNIKKKVIEKGYKTGADYDRVLEGINPIENLDNLPEDVKIWMGGFDKYCPPDGIKRIVEILKQRGRNPTVYNRPFSGHVITLKTFGNELRKQTMY